jgi:thioredoxin 1
MVKELNELEFKDAIKEGNVVVDCFAPWCGPCRMLAPIIDEVASELTDYTFYKLNVDDSQAIAEEYQIYSIPTILFFKDGKLEKKKIGLLNKEEIKAMLK